jgi:hypothetical protein
MNYPQWQPIYKQILQDMGYSQAEDERAAQILSQLLSQHKHTKNPEILRQLIEGKKTLVCGNAPTLHRELKNINTEDYDTIIAADGATQKLLEQGIQPTIIVTDLDADNIEAEIQASKQGSIILTHAHGDNIPLLKKIVPKLENVIGTTQATPLHNIHNFGGFTDGDRCAYLAAHYNATNITLIGFNFEDPNVNNTKKKKLKWAKTLINMLEREANINLTKTSSKS